jgi:hypothetical protein
MLFSYFLAVATHVSADLLPGPCLSTDGSCPAAGASQLQTSQSSKTSVSLSLQKELETAFETGTLLREDELAKGPPNWSKIIFGALDANGDGCINSTEFAALGRITAFALPFTNAGSEMSASATTATTTTTPKEVTADDFDVVDLRHSIGNKNPFMLWEGAAAYKGNVYLMPHKGSSVGVLDTATNKFRTIAISPPHDTCCKNYYHQGVVHDGKLYMSPQSANNIGVLDLKTEKFTSIDIRSFHPSGGRSRNWKFSDAFFANNKIYFTPWAAGQIGSLDITTQKFKALGKPLPKDYGFSAALMRDGKVYLPPMSGNHIGVFELSTEVLKLVDISSHVSTHWAFLDGAIYNGKAYFAPCHADKIGKFDLKTEKFSVIDLPEKACSKSKNPAFACDKCLYSGAVLGHGKIFFTPCTAGNIGVLDLATESFSTMDVSSKIDSTKPKHLPGGMYWKPVKVGGKAYLPPRGANNMGVLDF